MSRASFSGAALIALTLVVSVGCGRKQQPASKNGGGDALDAAASAAAQMAAGDRIYQQHCAVCHMADGSGVPNFQPELIGSRIVGGDVARLEAVIRSGSAALMDQRGEYSATMPPFGMLSEAEMKTLIPYLRKRFTPEAVAADGGAKAK